MAGGGRARGPFFCLAQEHSRAQARQKQDPTSLLPVLHYTSATPWAWKLTRDLVYLGHKGADQKHKTRTRRLHWWVDTVPPVLDNGLHPLKAVATLLRTHSENAPLHPRGSEILALNQSSNVPLKIPFLQEEATCSSWTTTTRPNFTTNMPATPQRQLELGASALVFVAGCWSISDEGVLGITVDDLYRLMT